MFYVIMGFREVDVAFKLHFGVFAGILKADSVKTFQG